MKTTAQHERRWEHQRRQENERRVLVALSVRAKPIDIHELGAIAGVNGTYIPDVMARLKRRGLARYVRSEKCPTCGHDRDNGGWVRV